MLKSLGRNRLIVLIILALLNAGTGYGLYEYITPMRVQADSNLNTARSALEQKRNEIQRLKEEYALLQTQLRDYKELEAKGFFNDQGRVAAQESFEKLRTVSGVLNAKYDISAGQLIDDQRASQAGYVILRSPIKVELSSLDDLDVYSFLKLIQERFSGKVDITSMTVTKAEELKPENLRKIGRGLPVPLVKSVVQFEWRTMASRESITPDTTGESQSQTPGTLDAPPVVTPDTTAEPVPAMPATPTERAANLGGMQ